MKTRIRQLPHGAPSGIRAEELNGTKRGQLSFVTIENAVRAIGFLKLQVKIDLSTIRDSHFTSHLPSCCKRMLCHPSAPLWNRMDGEIRVTMLREVIHLIGEDLAFMTKLTVSQYNERKNIQRPKINARDTQNILRVDAKRSVKCRSTWWVYQWARIRVKFWTIFAVVSAVTTDVN